MKILIATSNKGKLRDFAGAAAVHGIVVEPLSDLANIPEPVEDGVTFEANARKKAEYYSRFAPGELVLADDSGLAVDALAGAPGVYSARYSVMDSVEPIERDGHSIDAANNAKLLSELSTIDGENRTGRFVCVISAARDGKEVVQFRGEAQGTILHEPRGSMGFGYDPLFYFPAIGKTFAELTPDEKSLYSHRGEALRLFLQWAKHSQS